MYIPRNLADLSSQSLLQWGVIYGQCSVFKAMYFVLDAIRTNLFTRTSYVNQ